MTPGLVAYAATKGAIKMFAQGLSREVADREITVNNIQPGPIDTDLNPDGEVWAAPQKALTGAQALRQGRGHRRDGRLRRRPGSLVYHRGKPDRGRRHERLNVNPRLNAKAAPVSVSLAFLRR